MSPFVNKVCMTYAPQRQIITNITQANPAVVTTFGNHQLTTGQAVRINVPSTYGMVEIGGKLYVITVLSANSFSLQYTQVGTALNVNSTNFTAFSTPAKPGFTAEVLPVGSFPSPINTTAPSIINGTCETTIDDAWSNVSTSEIPI